jgi:hypothetical protein
MPALADERRHTLALRTARRLLCPCLKRYFLRSSSRRQTGEPGRVALQSVKGQRRFAPFLSKAFFHFFLLKCCSSEVSLAQRPGSVMFNHRGASGSSRESSGSVVSAAVLKQARATGQLTLSGRGEWLQCALDAKLEKKML